MADLCAGERILYARPDKDARCAGVPSLFRGKFPDVLLRDFSYTAGAYDPCVVMCYEGLESDLLHFGLVVPEMLAIRPKRIRFEHWGSEDGYYWSTCRLARKRVKVTLDGIPDFLRALEPFRADRWPWFESLAARRAYVQKAVSEDAAFVRGLLAGTLNRLVSGTLEKYGFRWKEDAQEGIEAFTEQFAIKLEHRLLAAPIESATRPALRIVS